MHDNCPDHWYLCVINVKNYNIQILDSLRSRNRDEFRSNSMKTMICFQTMFFFFFFLILCIGTIINTLKMNQVEFFQTFFKLVDIRKNVFQLSIDWLPSVPTQGN